MIVVRFLLIFFGVALATAGIVALILLPYFWPLGVELLLGGLVFIVGVGFERVRYHAKQRASGGEWVSTGEKFVDPTTGVLTEVYYNPQTGERSYRPG